MHSCWNSISGSQTKDHKLNLAVGEIIQWQESHQRGRCMQVFTGSNCETVKNSVAQQIQLWWLYNQTP